MHVSEALAILAAGAAAGAMNTVVGSGTLVSFPLLVGFGYPPLVANVSSKVGLAPGAVAGTVGYRSQLAGIGRWTAALCAWSGVGGFVGAVLLLSLPESSFEAAVPGLIGGAVVLMLVQSRIAAWLARRPRGLPRQALPVGAFTIGIYSGYFGAAQGILFLALLGLTLPEAGFQRMIGVKNALATVPNLVSATVLIVSATVDWQVAALLATGSALGGTLGARIGLRLPAGVFRAAVVAIGLAAIVRLLTS